MDFGKGLNNDFGKGEDVSQSCSPFAVRPLETRWCSYEKVTKNLSLQRRLII